MKGSFCSSLPSGFNSSNGLVPYWAFMYYIGENLIGIGVYAVLFGFSFSTSVLCLYYLFKNWKPTCSHHLTTSFTLLLTLYNIFVVVASIMTLFWGVCSGFFTVLQVAPGPVNSVGQEMLGVAYVPVFLWISDAFLLYRAWEVWIHRRLAILLPSVFYLASIVTWIAWLVRGVRGVIYIYADSLLFQALLNNTETVGFSLGLDVLITGMIAGRLIYHHKRISASAGGSFSVLPVAIIFIESAALSVVSKVVQIALAMRVFYNAPLPPFIIPLCTLSSNFIILRKALGTDITRIADHPKQHLSTIQFQAPSHRPTETIGSIPGGFESHLRTMLGNPANRNSDLDWEDRRSGCSRA